MPRQARIDVPGALHHITCRAIERRNIFKDNTDRNRFLERLGLSFAKDLHTLLRLGVDSESFPYSFKNRQRADCSNYATTSDRLCGYF
jgi:hypothetical protein